MLVYSVLFYDEGGWWVYRAILFLLDIRDNVHFRCPYPVLGVNVIVDRDICQYDWFLLGAIGASFLAVLACVGFVTSVASV